MKRLLFYLSGAIIAVVASYAMTVSAQVPVRPTKATVYPNGVATKPGGMYYFANYPTDTSTVYRAPAVFGDVVSVNGTTTLTVAAMNTITCAAACLAQAPSLNASEVYTTWTANVLTIGVMKPTSSSVTTPIASTTATLVSYMAGGND